MTTIRRTMTTVLSMLGSATFAGAPIFSPLSPHARDLSHYRWEARPVLIFASDPQDADFKDQISELREAKEGLLDRDIVVLTDTNPGANGTLREELDVEGFEIVLVGKDGAIKLRKDQPLTARALFEKVDSMPMRQREMNE